MGAGRRAGGGGPLGRLGLAVGAAALLALLAAAAHAQQGVDLYRELEVGPKTGVDTDYTPNPRDGGGIWEQVAGARFGWDADDGPEGRGVVGGSVTSFDDDLHAVGFRNTELGAAGGSRRIECEGRKVEVPVIYHYGRGTSAGDTEPRWRQVAREQIASDCNNPGYVGAIAWITSKRALAVGGDGAYPEREPAYSDDGQELEPDPNTAAQTKRPKGAYGERRDPAGKARAWLYDQGRWRELDLSRETGPCPAPSPEQWRCGMRGMSALDFDPRSGADFEFGVAGALGQLWLWEGERGEPGGFSAKHGEGRTTPGQFAGGNTPAPFRFRVRDIEIATYNPPRFSGGTPVTPANTRAIWAVTAGCCAADPARNFPRLLSSGGDGASWGVHEIANRRTHRPDAAAGGQEVNAEVNPRQDIPDSFYSLTVSPYLQLALSGAQGTLASMIVTPGGPPDPNLERPSILTPAYCVDRGGGFASNDSGLIPLGPTTEEHTDPLGTALRTSLSSARLVAGDGDVHSSFGFYSPGSGAGQSLLRPQIERIDFRPSTVSGTHTQVFMGSCNTTDHARGLDGTFPDGVPDWAVGELRSTEIEGRGARALALATALNATLSPDVVNLGRYSAKETDPSAAAKPPQPSGENLANLGEDPDKATEWLTSREKLAEYAKSRYFLLPSYSLHAIDVIDPTDTGWAVGEHGAILRLGGEDGAGPVRRNEPPPPPLGSRAPAPLPERHPYEAHRPASAAEAEPVPALAERPRRRLAEGRLAAVGYGSPHPSLTWFDGVEDVRQIVISRDGSEGWALGGDRFEPVSKTQLATTTLFHYDGESWGRCDPLGVADQLEPDPACATLRDLPLYARRPNPDAPHHVVAAPVRILGAARIPYERDSDPSNDDEFEILATASLYTYPGEQTERPAVLRYREGRWELATDPAAQGLRGLLSATGRHEIALVGADEGWILDGVNLLHFDGTRWSRCQDAGCDPGLATGEIVGAHLAVAGDRVFLSGSRRVPAPAGDTVKHHYYPLILHRAPGEAGWSADPARYGYDPGSSPDRDPDRQGGTLSSLAIVPHPEGGYEGWATGSFGVETTSVDAGCIDPRGSLGLGSTPICTGQTTVESRTAAHFLRLAPGGGWRQFADPGLYSGQQGAQTVPTRQIVVPGTGAFHAELQPHLEAGYGPGGSPRCPSICEFDAAGERWRELPGVPPGSGAVRMLAPDNRGGFWAATLTGSASYTEARVHFVHYTKSPPEPYSRRREPPSGRRRTTSPRSPVPPTARCGPQARAIRSTATTA